MSLIQDILVDTTLKCPDHIAIVSGHKRLSYSEMMSYAWNLSHFLFDKGVKPGDRVAIFMDSNWKCAASIFGVLMAGGVFVIINSQTKKEKLLFILRDAGIKVVLSEPYLSRVYNSCLDQAEVFCDVENELLKSIPYIRTEETDLATILYTSGTTGVPKGVMHTHKSLLFVLNSINEYLGFTIEDRLFSTLPLNFGYGLFQLLSSVSVGATLVLESSFAFPVEVFNKMKMENVTTFAGVPTLFSMILAQNDRKSLQFPSVKLVTNAAAALPEKFISGIKSVFPYAELFKMYGQSEVIRTAYLSPELAEVKPNSTGRAIPGTQVFLLDSNLQPVKQGEVGMLYVKGSHIMMGYWNDPEKTKEVLIPDVNGETMLKSGDLFYQDEEGDLYFVSRNDDIIKSKGEKVSPLEVENVIYKLPGVQEVSVIGVPDSLLGEAIVAFVVADQVTEKQIKKICLEYLESYMVPKHIIFVDSLIRNNNGKVSKALLKKQYNDIFPE